MVTTKLNLSMTEPSARQIYAKQGDTGRVLDITLDQTPEDGTLRILRPDGTEVTSEAVAGGEVESGSTFESLTEADVTELTVGIEPVQDLSHGDPSPTNICPITGHDEVRVTRTGKNLYNSAGLNRYGEHGITVTQSGDGTLVFNGTATNNAYFIFENTGYENKRYTYSLNNPVTNSGVHIAFRDTNGNYFGDAPANTVNMVVTFTNEPNGIYLYVLSGTTLSNFTVKPQVELGSTATSYEPYRSNTYTTSLGQTVYGGTLDMVSGVLTVDKAMVTAPTRGSLDSSGKLYRLNGLSGQKMWDSSTRPTEYAITNQFSAQSLEGARQTGEKCFVQYGDEFFVGGFIGDTATLDTLLTTLQVLYDLAVPLTYTLTAQQIKTLVGTNNVWASSGDIVNITFTYGGLLSELPSDATSVAGKCYCDIEQNGVSSMPFTLNVKKNERES